MANGQPPWWSDLPSVPRPSDHPAEAPIALCLIQPPLEVCSRSGTKTVPPWSSASQPSFARCSRDQLAFALHCPRASCAFLLLLSTFLHCAYPARRANPAARTSVSWPPTTSKRLPSMPFKRIDYRDLNMYYVLNPDPATFARASHENLPPSNPFKPGLPVLVFIHAGASRTSYMSRRTC